MFKQEDFDKLVENYNQDYRYLLIRASQQSYDCLITSFMMLKDLYDVVIKFQEYGGYEFRIFPYPLSFRANEELLTTLGFSGEEVKHIFEFLDFVKQTQGQEFEDCLKGDIFDLCKKEPGDDPWQTRRSLGF